jgi:hypothetical protein
MRGRRDARESAGKIRRGSHARRRFVTNWNAIVQDDEELARLDFAAAEPRPKTKSPASF